MHLYVDITVEGVEYWPKTYIGLSIEKCNEIFFPAISSVLPPSTVRPPALLIFHPKRGTISAGSLSPTLYRTLIFFTITAFLFTSLSLSGDNHESVYDFA